MDLPRELIDELIARLEVADGINLHLGINIEVDMFFLKRIDNKIKMQSQLINKSKDIRHGCRNCIQLDYKIVACKQCYIGCSSLDKCACCKSWLCKNCEQSCSFCPTILCSGCSTKETCMGCNDNIILCCDHGNVNCHDECWEFSDDDN